MDVILNNKYKLTKNIGEGTFGKIFEAINTHTDELVAIKIEKKIEQSSSSSTNVKNVLKHEANIYGRCKGIKGIPQLRFYGTIDNYSYMVIDKLGGSICSLMRDCGDKFNLRTVIILGIQLLNIIEKLHNIGIVHRDLKPDNVLIGTGKNRKQFYLIDFGLSKHILNSDGTIIPMNTNRSLTGTAKYVSLNVHNGIEPSMRDDLESIAYILIYCLKGKLPWQFISGESKNKKYQNIKEAKEKTTLQELCIELPLEILIFISYCKSLKYDELPDYNYLRCVLYNLFKHKKYSMDDEFEWSV
jgi:serine/threonine protein kinase